MNISMKFISRYVDLPADLTYDQIAYDLTMRTVEVEDVIDTAAKFHDIVVGEIKEVRHEKNIFMGEMYFYGKIVSFFFTLFIINYSIYFLISFSKKTTMKK